MDKNQNIPEPQTTDCETKPIETPTPTRKVGFLTFFSFIVLAFFASAAAMILVNQHQAATQNNTVQALQTTLVAIKDQQLALTNQLQQSNAEVETQQKSLKDQMNALTTHLEAKPAVESSPTEPLWILKKAHYYLELAQINAQWSEDTRSSLALLNEAESLLENNPDERIAAVRQSLAQEIAKLNAIPQLNSAELIRSLDKAQITLDTLALKPLKSPPKQKATPTNWRERLDESLALIQQLVVVRHYNKEDPSLLAIRYPSLLREQLAMDILEAKWAVLQRNSALYQEALGHLIKVIHTTISSETIKTMNTQTLQQTKTSDFLSQLQQLEQVQLTSVKPDVKQALTELDAIINSKN